MYLLPRRILPSKSQPTSRSLPAGFRNLTAGLSGDGSRHVVVALAIDLRVGVTFGGRTKKDK